ncbi:TonB-dependent receptor [Arcticibacter svalbardensis MN12-7]|uniref:TonB-dependent receptor n=2 Tax=Arcticibacter TaxID=1288026 RepID=R9GQA8_9SPHI|nr:TonB-dependent receptor [Arcticibacter svalbardensis MN12-7]
MCISFGAFAQSEFTGKVTDQIGEPIIGATIRVKGTKSGTVTDVSGSFKLKGTGKETIQISYIGFQTQEIALNGKSNIMVQLKDDKQALDEVVVVGFGTQKKTTLTGSVSQVSGDEVMKGKGTSSAALALQGEVSGLVVTRTSSRPGNEGIAIQIRGDISVNGVSPLILLDGLEIPLWQLSTINANDIATYSVLKDGAAAIYGTKAAGGVILITTKKGKTGAPKINYSGVYQLNHPNSFPVANFKEWSQMWLQAGDNGAPSYVDATGAAQTGSPNYRFFTRQNLLDIIDGTFPMSPNAYTGGTWINQRFADVSNYDAIYGTTASQRHDVSLSGGNEKVTYRSSLGYSDERSPIAYVYDGAKKYNFRTNITYKLNDLLSTDFNVSYDNRFINSPTQGIGTGVHDAAMFPLYNPQGEFYDIFGGNNPLALLSQGGRTKTTDQIFRLGGKITLDFNKYIKGLSLNYLGNISERNSIATTRTTSVTMYDWDGTVSYTPTTLLGSGVKNDQDTQFFQNHVLQANYNRSIDKHNIGLMIGATAEQDQINSYTMSRKNMASDDLDDINTGDVTTQTTSGGASAVGLMSYIGKVNYDYNGIYLLEGLGRRDGSSRLAPDYRWKNFFSASAGIRLSELGVIKDLEIFDNLKLRTSYGETGSVTGIGKYDYISNISAGTALFGSSPAWANTAYIGSMTSTERTWERIANTNYALDFSVLHNRLSGTIELYHRKNIGMLVNVTYPQVLGATAPSTNSGDFTNDGTEFTLNWRDNIGDLKYNIGFMYWDSRSNVTKMTGKTAISYGTNSIVEGKPLNAIYAYRTDGYLQSENDVLDYYNKYSFVDPSNQNVLKSNSLLNAAPYTSAYRLVPGSVKRVDVNNDGIISTADLVYQGDANPHDNFSISLGLDYKGFDFSAFLQGVGQQNIVRTGYLSGPFVTWFANQNSTFLGKTWTTTDTNAPYPIMTYANNGAVTTWNYSNTNDINVIHARYLRAKVLTLGYTLPKNIVDKAGIEKVRFSVTGNDLFVISNVKDGLDPEMNSSATNGTILPYTKTLLFGVDVTF